MANVTSQLVSYKIQKGLPNYSSVTIEVAQWIQPTEDEDPEALLRFHFAQIKEIAKAQLPENREPTVKITEK